MPYSNFDRLTTSTHGRLNWFLSMLLLIILLSGAASSAFGSAEGKYQPVTQSWKICYSHHNETLLPPSKWDAETFQRRCFLHRNESASFMLSNSIEHMKIKSTLNTPNPSTRSSFSAVSRLDISAPGTALFQHWLADYESSISNGPVDDYVFDPRNDFPTQKVMKNYPDISVGGLQTLTSDTSSFESSSSSYARFMRDYERNADDEDFVANETVPSGRDFYTLWYTTSIPTPYLYPEIDTNEKSYFHSNNEGINVSRVMKRVRRKLREGKRPNVADKLKSGSSVDSSTSRLKRGHLTLHGVNYQPVVYFNQSLLNPYSTYPGDTEVKDVGGMFIRRHYDLGTWSTDEMLSTSSLSAPLEILVLPPPVVGGLGDPRNPTEGQGGDHNLAQSGPIMQCTAGWDWIASTPDRNTGIWDKVQISWVWGDVRLHDVWVKVLNVSVANDDMVHGVGDNAIHGHSKLPIGEDVGVSTWLELSVTATRHGTANDEVSPPPIRGTFDYLISHSKDDSIILAEGTIHNFTIQQSAEDFHLGEIHLPSGKLWWPHTHGTQTLYNVKVTFRSYDAIVQEEQDGSSDGGTSSLHVHEAEAESTFGIRTISSYTHPKTKSFVLKVNGHSIFLQGGNWVTTDQFLRFSSSPKRYFQELRLMREAGFNSIRVWGGGITETSSFYHAADVLGLLVYQEFWMTGDNNGRWAGSYDWPFDHETFLLNVRDVVRRLRNRPSLAWFGGGNELYPNPSRYSASVSGVSPPVDIERGMRKYIADLDGSRPYTTTSVMDIGENFDPEIGLGPKDGPYGVLDEARFYDRNPGLTSPILSEEELRLNVSLSEIMDKDSPGRNIGFQAEIGSVSFPELESLKRFLSAEALESFPNCSESSDRGGSVHEEWKYFKYLPFTEITSHSSTTEDKVDHICSFHYPPFSTNSSTNRMDSSEDYSWAAQLVQYLQYKSLFEGYSHRMWEWYSAVYLWKASSPSPTFRGALYDWYLETNGGYWGVHASLNGGGLVRLALNNGTVHVVNASPLALVPPNNTGVEGQGVWGVQWHAYSFNGTFVGSGKIPIPGFLEANKVAHLGELVPWLGVQEVSIPDYNIANLQDVLLYRLALSYRQDRSNLSITTTNTFFKTPPVQGSQQRRSRYALLGALRSSMPKISIDLQCHISTSTSESLFSSTRNIDVDCSIFNPTEYAAVMSKLTLVRSFPPGANQKDSRILPTFFSQNYITLEPGESITVHLSTDSTASHCSGCYPDSMSLEKLWGCDDSGRVELLESTDDPSNASSEGVILIVSVDGWNVLNQAVTVECSIGAII